MYDKHTSEQIENQFNELLITKKRTKELPYKIADFLSSVYLVDPAISSQYWTRLIESHEAKYRQFYLCTVYSRLLETFDRNLTVDLLAKDFARVQQVFEFAHSRTNLSYRAVTIIGRGLLLSKSE